jgi:hypothetical protein
MWQQVKKNGGTNLETNMCNARIIGFFLEEAQMTQEMIAEDN